jgi:hypothetical protein
MNLPGLKLWRRLQTTEQSDAQHSHSLTEQDGNPYAPPELARRNSTSPACDAILDRPVKAAVGVFLFVFFLFVPGFS